MTSPSPRSPAVVPRGTGRPADPLPSPRAPDGQGSRAVATQPRYGPAPSLGDCRERNSSRAVPEFHPAHLDA